MSVGIAVQYVVEACPSLIFAETEASVRACGEFVMNMIETYLPLTRRMRIRLHSTYVHSFVILSP